MPLNLTKLKVRWLLVWGSSLALCAGSVMLTMTGLYAALSPDERVIAQRLFAHTGDLALLLGVAVLAGLAMLSAWIARAYFGPLLRAAEHTRLIANANPSARLDATGPREMRTLAHAVNDLAAHVEQLRNEDAQRIEQARADLERERHRLAALMSELTQGVVVCNADGRIVLYNESARTLLTASADAVSGVAGYMGIGRSLYALLHKESVEHALGQSRARIAAGTDDPVTTFATAIAGGAVMRVRITPLPAASAADGGDGGFVLLLEDLGRELSELAHRDALLTDLIESSRAAIASVRAAIENLAGQPDMRQDLQARFLSVAQDELLRLTRLVEEAGSSHASRMNRRPDLHPIRLSELIQAVAGRIHAIPGARIEVQPADAAIWVQVDSYSVMQGVRYLVRRLLQRRDPLAMALHATSAGEHVYLDLVWAGDAIAAPTVLEWETAPLSAGGEPGDSTLRALIARNRAEFWHDVEPASGLARFRIMLRHATPEPAGPQGMQGDRPVYYDFDLFRQSDRNRALDDVPLSALSYTVFDTETTGLEPSAGDEIISIGAVRIVNGRLLRGESFDQLIDPKRPIDPEAVKIHGIRSSMLAGQPDIGRVLPAFHRFCEETVLVAHNAAFDLRFLQVKQSSTGVTFAHPVLDTLVLSSVLNEALDDHRLEAIARRMGIDVIARHTALGDAILAAEVFLRMLPLLAAQGIVTLRQAREASERTYYAKLRY